MYDNSSMYDMQHKSLSCVQRKWYKCIGYATQNVLMCTICNTLPLKLHNMQRKSFRCIGYATQNEVMCAICYANRLHAYNVQRKSFTCE